MLTMDEVSKSLRRGAKGGVHDLDLVQYTVFPKDEDAEPIVRLGFFGSIGLDALVTALDLSTGFAKDKASLRILDHFVSASTQWVRYSWRMRGDVKLVINGEEEVFHDLLVLPIGKIPNYGLNYVIMPHARGQIADGNLYALASDANFGQAAEGTRQALFPRAEPIGNQGGRRIVCKEISVKPANKTRLPCQINGEYEDEVRRLDARVLPGAFKLQIDTPYLSPRKKFYQSLLGLMSRIKPNRNSYK
jgi:hypothetical protein